MKKNCTIFFLISAVFLMSSCSNLSAPQPTEEPTPQPTVAAPSGEKLYYKKAELLTKLCGLYGLDDALLKKTEEGALNYAAGVSELPETVSVEQVELLKRLVKYDPELFFIKDISLSADGLSIDISYHLEQLASEKERQELVSKIDFFVSSTVNQNYTQFENALSAYSFLSKNVSAETNVNLNCYDLFVRSKGNSLSFAKAFQFLLAQADIESYVTSSVEGDFWITAKIDGKYYHFNPYLEAKISHGQNFDFFAITDEEAKYYYTEWLVQDGLIEAIAENTDFSYLRNFSDCGIDLLNRTIYCIDKNDNDKIIKYSYIDGTSESVYNKRAQAMVYKNTVIYFADLDNRNKLYVLDLSNGEQEELDSVFVTRMYTKDGNLIYFDDVSSSEGSIIIK